MNPNDLHWTESNIESISTSARELVVIASQVFAPGSQAGLRVKATFRGVSEANLEITEYIGSPYAPDGFKPPYVLAQLSIRELPGTITYGLEGVSTFPPIAWLNLEIQAQEAIVETL